MEDEWFLSQPCTVFVFLKRRAHELIQRSVSRKGLHNGLMFQKYTFSIKSVTDFVNISFSGYRHVRLLSSQGEILESATLFVHVTITNLNDAAAVSISELKIFYLTIFFIYSL